MRYSNTAITELSAKYRSVLKKCALLNAAILLTTVVALPVSATEITERIVVAADETKTISDASAEGLSYSSEKGGVIYNEGTLNLIGTSTFTNNTAKNGGAVYSKGNLTVSDGLFSGNTKSAIYLDNAGTATVSGTFFNNTGTSGGAIYTTRTVTTVGGAFRQNSSSTNVASAGGAIANSQGTLIISDDTLFENNLAKSAGGGAISAGGINSSYPAEVIIGNNVKFEGNLAGYSDFDASTVQKNTVSGGAIYVSALAKSLSFGTGVEFNKNKSAGTGGALHFGGAVGDGNGFLLNNGVKFVENEARQGGALSSDVNVATNIDSSVLFSGNKATDESLGIGGAIVISGKTLNQKTKEAAIAKVNALNINGSTFERNKSAVDGGAIGQTMVTVVDSKGKYSWGMTININEGTTFTENEAVAEGGAIVSDAILNVTKATFTGNKTTGTAIGTNLNDSNEGGGAVFLYDDSVTTIENSSFSDNVSGTWGGAISVRGISSGDTGADSMLTVNGSIFSGNQAVLGGAIANALTKAFISDSIFTDNTVSDKGGAIYNIGTLALSGTNTFSGNKANGESNDIYNDGTLNISGTLVLDGGIVNDGEVVFTSGSSLKAALNNSTALISGGTVTGTTALVIENGTGDAKFKMFDVDQTFDLTNSVYDVVKDTEVVGQYLISKKSTDEVVENLTKNGEATAQEAATISAIADTTVSNPVLDKITEAVQSGDVKTAAKAAKDLAPTTSQAALGISKDVQSLLTNAATARMAALAGRSGGDVFQGGSMWVQGLYNHTKQDSTAHNEGFKANSKGIAFGIDGKLNDAVTLGLGYGYTRTDADAGARDIDVDGNNVFAYAEYAPDAWYVNGVLNFGYGRYTEKKSPAGYTKKSKYDVYTYGANLMTGYAFDSGLTPEGGLRYLLVDQKSYDDGIQKISTSNNDVLTAVLGAKYGYKVKAKDWMFTPNVRLAATYDVMSDGSKAVASITGGSSYQITGERLHRLGFEAGVGVTSTWNNWDFTLSYDGGFRKDYQSHTGTLKAKYHF